MIEIISKINQTLSQDIILVLKIEGFQLKNSYIENKIIETYNERQIII